MHPHAKLIENFYTSFTKLDSAGMRACYHPEAEFSDPVFPALKGMMVGDMWEMLCTQAKGFDLHFKNVEADDVSASASWSARYQFGGSGRWVHNHIEATFRFQDGQIIQHTDHFSFWKWSRMALGVPGMLLGWTPFLKRQVQGQAARNLEKFRNKALHN